MASDERPMWGIHMERQHGLSPIRESFIAIGWPAVGDLSRMPRSREAFKNAVAEAYPEKTSGAIPVDAGTLFKFVHEMKKGDLLVYPSKPDRMVNLGTIQGDYQFDTKDSDWPNRRTVKWRRHMARAEFSQSALHEIGSAVTLFQIRNNTDEFLAAFEGEPFDVAEVDAETAEATSVTTEESTAAYVTKRLKSGLDPYQFEKFVAHLLECMGYHTRITQKSGDGGVDIIAHKDELGFEEPVIKVQCKQPLSNAGQPEVAQLYGHVAAREYGLFVTLGDYTAQARQFERSKHNLRLINGEELIGLIYVHYEKFDPRYQALLPMKKVYIPGVIGGDTGS